MRPVNVIGVAGAGAWGVALANAAAAAGRTVILWGRDDTPKRAMGAARGRGPRPLGGRDETRMRAMAATRRSDRLPGVDLARAVEATADLVELGRCDAILVAAPAQSSREIVLRLATIPGSAGLVSCAKGIERGANAFMTEVLAE